MIIHQIKKVNHFDMNEDVIKYAMLEFYCLTGEFSHKTNMKCINSFQYDFGDKKAVKTASSTNFFFIKTGRILAFLCFKTDLLLERFAAILVAISPLSRIIPIAEKPDGVD